MSNLSIVNFNTLYQKIFGTNPPPIKITFKDPEFYASISIGEHEITESGLTKKIAKINVCDAAIKVLAENNQNHQPHNNKNGHFVIDRLEKWLRCDKFYDDFLTDLGIYAYKDIYDLQNNKKLLFRASIHASGLCELLHLDTTIKSNERLEWLGDRFLNFCIAKNLYESPLNNNTIQTQYMVIISNANLADIAKKNKLHKYLIYSDDISIDINTKIMADYCEAIIGALSLISGELATKFIEKTIIPFTPNNEFDKFIDDYRKLMK